MTTPQTQITTDWMELVPAYGRNYRNKAEVLAAWQEGKDFEGDYSIGFRLCSRRDFAPGTSVILRYKNNTMSCTTTA